MPQDPSQRGQKAEQLSRKIERLLSGQPSPLLDTDTEELAEIARLLHEHLPKDLPDPGFRAQLKQDLIDPQPRLVPFSPRRRSRRYPVPVLAGALAVVMFATAATGWMAFGDHDSARNLAGNDETPTLALSTVSSGMAVAFATRTANEQLRDSEANVERPTATQNGPEPTPETQPTATAAAPTRTPVTAASPRLPESTTTNAPREVALASLPPVDREHVELGALATAGPEATDEFTGVEFEIDGVLPMLEPQAPAYQFATPYVDPRVILRGIGDFLGIDEEPRIEDLGGRQVYTLASDSSEASFTWFPSSGAFSCTLHVQTSPEQGGDIGAAAIKWLQEFGFPIDPERVQPVIQTMEDGQRIVHIPLGELPDPAVGHPLRVSLVVDENGSITRVSGYWLQVTGTVDVPLLSSEDAWRALVSGAGYWPDRPAPGEPGRFVIEEFGVSHVLTLGENGEQLVLQPVIRAGGIFHPDGGEPVPTAIYLQAATAVASS